ncbi:MAG TPA: response regulator [Devosia sp.]|jgi:CheY-like chemotaxis protein|nr:response regulator [Devosia sp.]
MDHSDTNIGSATILVVDDDALININTVDMVQELGHTALEAYSAREALDILNGRKVDVLITDYSMPGMSGLELAHKAREIQPELSVLLATGYGDLPDGHVTDLPRLSKPFQQDELVELLARVLPLQKA